MGKLTKQQQQILVLIIAFVLGGGYTYWNYMLKPTLQKISVNQEKYKDLTAKVETAERQSRRLPALQAEVEKLRVELASLEKQLPKDKDIPNILRILTREALQESMEFNRLAPKPIIRQTYFEIIPFDLQFTGTLHSLARFLASLGQQDRIFQTQNISLVPGGSSAESAGFTRLIITLTIQTYAYTG